MSTPLALPRPHRTRSFAWTWLLLLGACASPRGTSAPPTVRALANVDVQAELGRALARLSESGQTQTRTTSDGALEISGPPATDESLGSGLFGSASAPKPAEIDATFGQYCKLRGAPIRTVHDGYTRLTYRGTERRSGAECTLVADLPKAGRWRFVLRIQRNASSP